MLVIEIEGASASAWDGALDPYLDRWPDDLRVVEGGPGSVGLGTPGGPMPPSAEDPSR